MGVYKDPKRLALGPLKLFKDGSLGGRTAAMRKEYQDDPGNRGVECITKEEMDESPPSGGCGGDPGGDPCDRRPGH